MMMMMMMNFIHVSMYFILLNYYFKSYRAISILSKTNQCIQTNSSAKRISMDERLTCNHDNNVNGRTPIFIRIINGSRL